MSIQTPVTDATVEPVVHPVAAQAKSDARMPLKKVAASPVKAPKNTAIKPPLADTAKKAPSAASKVLASSKKAPKSKAAKAAPAQPQKIKMVRDSFTFPEIEHKRLVEMKRRLIALGIEVKKGELVRAGLELLAALENQKLLNAVAGVEKLKTGRPKK